MNKKNIINQINNPSKFVKKIDQYDSFIVLKLDGSFDLNTIPPVEDMLKKYKHFMEQDVVLDFEDVSHIDTSTLAVLIYVIDKLKDKKKKMCLINCNDLVKDYIRIGKVGPIISVYNTLEDVFSNI